MTFSLADLDRPTTPGAAPTSAPVTFGARDIDQPTFRSTNAKDDGGNAIVRAGGDALAGWWETVSPVPLIQAVSTMTADEFASARRAADKGDYTGAVLHALNAHPVTSMGNEYPKARITASCPGPWTNWQRVCGQGS